MLHSLELSFQIRVEYASIGPSMRLKMKPITILGLGGGNTPFSLGTLMLLGDQAAQYT